MKIANIELRLLTNSDTNALGQTTGNLPDIRYISVPSPADMASYVTHALSEHTQGNRIPYVVVDTDTQQIIGTTSYYNIEPKIGKYFIGYTWYAEDFHKTHVNTCCKFLLLQNAFENLNLNAIGFHTDLLNLNSQRAIERLGAKKDGIVRNERLRKDGTLRDTVIYSILKNEWPELKARLMEKIRI
jgi:N-acetyltransferase